MKRFFILFVAFELCVLIPFIIFPGKATNQKRKKKRKDHLPYGPSVSQNQCLGMRVRVRDSWQTSQQPERGCGVEDWADPIRWRWAGSQVKNKKQKNIWCGDGSAGRTCSHTHSQSRRTPDCTSAPAFSNELHTHVSLLVIRTKEAS